VIEVDMATATKEKKAPQAKSDAKPKGRNSGKGLDPPAPDPSTVKLPPPPPVAASPVKAEVPAKALPVAFDPKKLREIARDFGQISDSTRLHVILLLDQSPMNVGDICKVLGEVSQPALSHHLALLRNARIIDFIRDGRTNVYELAETGQVLARAAKEFMGG
jgi:DNA-binding transcriptional ArsR family regulator